MPMSETLTREPAAATGTVEVTMPPTGSQLEVTVTAWLKHPGDQVNEHDALCLVAWGDASAEIASSASGVMRMVTVAAGDRVAVGATLAVIHMSVDPGRFAIDPIRG